MPHVIAARYELVREVGRGGMGSVWLGHDLVLDRQVALKRVGLLPGAAKADVERVRREARVSAMVNHPNVVAVFDLVEEDDRHWLVMEYVESRTLAELAKAKRGLKPDQVADIVRQAAEALASAHASKIVHRDVKPSNILVTRDGVAKLGDFGIARAASDPTLTQTGLVTGSPGYLAPEVATGSAATPASDVWSLGATVFHAVTGRPPYDSGENVMATLYKLVNEEPPQTDRAGWLTPLLAATMNRDPRQRWTARQVATFLANGPAAANETAVLPAAAPASRRTPQPTLVAPVPPPPESPTRVFAATTDDRRRWSVPLALAGALLVAIAFSGWWLVRDNDDDPAADPPGTGETTSESTPRATEAGMEQFIEDYLSTVTRDPETTWNRLTPAFQQASGGFDSYTGFWGGIESAELLTIDADPEDLVVRYTVRYTHKDPGNGNGNGGGDDDEEEKNEEKKKDEPRTTTDDVTLELTFDGSRYKIDFERN